MSLDLHYPLPTPQPQIARSAHATRACPPTATKVALADRQADTHAALHASDRKSGRAGAAPPDGVQALDLRRSFAAKVGRGGDGFGGRGQVHETLHATALKRPPPERLGFRPELSASDPGGAPPSVAVSIAVG